MRKWGRASRSGAEGERKRELSEWQQCEKGGMRNIKIFRFRKSRGVTFESIVRSNKGSRLG